MSDDRRLEAVKLPINRKRSQSTIAFPYCDLASSERLAGHVLDGGGECRPEQLATWLGHSTLNSGAFRNKVAAAGQFGLVEASRNLVRLTSLGKRTLDESMRRQARAEAFLEVPLYLTVFEKFRGARLPAVIALEQLFIDEGVTRTQSRFARQVFSRSAEQAGFFETTDTKLTLPKGAHFPFEAQDPPPEPKRPDNTAASLPRLIEAILEEAPWDEPWARAAFEEWADLLVRAARVHFGFRSEP